MDTLSLAVVGAIGVLLLQWIERRDAREALDRTAFADGPCAAAGPPRAKAAAAPPAAAIDAMTRCTTLAEAP